MVQRRAFVGGILFLLLFAGVMVGLGSGGWPGQASPCVAEDNCYCEVGTGFVAQPANTFSNLGFVAVGLMVLWHASGESLRFGGDRIYPILYGAAALFLGTGSMALHGTLTSWGQWLDNQAMHIFISFPIAYNMKRSHGWQRTGFFVAFLAIAGTALIVHTLVPEHSRQIFGVMVGLALIAEVMPAQPTLRRWSRQPALRGNRAYLLAAGGVFALAAVVWVVSHTGGMWCNPTSLLQGHALWHLLTAAAVALLYLHLRSQPTDVPAQSEVTASR